MESKTLVGFRLSADEARTLDKLVESWGTKTRSEALRVLLHNAAKFHQPSDEAFELPPTLRTELENLVEEGWAHEIRSALAMVVNRGLDGLSEDVRRRADTMSQRAHELKTRRTQRRENAQRGQKFLREGE